MEKTRALDPTVLDEIVQRIREVLQPEKIILFGSHARGEAGEYSDIDLLVVMENPPAWKEGFALAEEIAQDLPLQLVFLSPLEWEETRDVVGGIAYPAYREGRVLYAA